MYVPHSVIEYWEVYTVGAKGIGEEVAIPFVHTVQLKGLGRNLIPLQATFDDAAMVNVIDSALFAIIRKQLTGVTTSNKVLRMANGTLVPSGGAWTGQVVIGNAKAEGTFEVFPCGGAWEMLFGKPMLHAFNASHEYVGDTVTLQSEGTAYVLENTNVPKVTGAEGLQETKVAVASVSNLGEHFGVSPLRQRQAPDFVTCCSVDQASPSTPDLNEAGPDISPETHIARALKKRIRRKQQRQRQQQRKLVAAALHTLWDRLEMTADPGTKAVTRKVRHLRGTRDLLQKSQLRRWTRSRWDFGCAETTNEETRTEVEEDRGDVELPETEPCRKATVEDCLDEETFAEGVRISKVAVAPTSNPGAHKCAAPLKQRQVVNEIYPKHTDDHFEKNTPVLSVEEVEHSLEGMAPGAEQPEIAIDADQSIFTWTTDAFKTERIAEIVRLIKIGDDISPEERTVVEDLIKEFPDIFALSVSEVKHIPGATHRLEIPEGTTFNTKIKQRAMSPPQTAYFSNALDIMLEAGICAPIAAKDVKCVSPITLATKAHTSGGMTIDELRQRLNEECEHTGITPPFTGPSDAKPLPAREADTSPPKWRVCTNYMRLNEVTHVLQMPQGDIRTKQQALSGHRWISMFDFAAGLYAIEIAEESRPYTAFYVEGRGYFVYCRMPFSLTGAPSCFNEVTARALHGLVGTLIQLFVDDGAMAGDVFPDKLANLRTFFTRCREESLSLSPQKTKLFMTEVVFAGERVGSKGIQADLTKLTAVVNWETPTTIQNLEAFLGLTGYFRPLIKNYSLLEKPLKDLANTLIVPKTGGKQAYRNAARAHRLANQWTPAHSKAFVVLKVALSSAPVIKSPKYDGSHFVVTTDGCKDGFAGVLSQQFNWIDKKGNTHNRTHPIAFASKRTSDAETRYQPYLLEFAALKYSLDKFSDVIGGYPVEIETDCQALRDTIINNKLNATHARWLDGIMGHHIVDCRHKPGRLNQAADGISRQFTDNPKRKGDGHEWTVDPSWAANTGLAYNIWSAQLDETQTNLRTRFANEPIFLEVIDAMHNIDHGKRVRDKRRARHRMLGYQIDDGRLWRIGDGKSTRARARLECVTQEEAKALAQTEHEKGGHFGRDLIKIALLDRICSPRLDKSIMAAIVECGRCKGFGGQHLAALLKPITRRHPWELLVGDYLSMPVGRGGFHTIGLFMDVYSQKIFGFKYTSHGTTATTIASLNRIRQLYRMPEVFMADGGSHFAGHVVRDWCDEHVSHYHQVSAYSPWVNGLLEGTNGKLLSRLKRFCAPNLGEDEWAKITKFEDLPANWPTHFDTAIEQLNARILPAYKFSPDELCLGIVVNTVTTPVEISGSELKEASIAIQNDYVSQQRLDAYSHIVEHANKRKIAFDKRVQASKDGVIEYKKGDLIQI